MAATPYGFHSRDKLLGMLWPESDLDHARNSLRQSLYFLRRRLGSEAIVNRGEGEVGLARESLACDVSAFEEALEAEEWERALDLYRADLLEGFFLPGALPFEQWLEEERARLRRDAVRGALRLCERAIDANDEEGARAWARRAVELDPLDELSVRTLIETLTRFGDGATAVHVYAEFTDRLEREYELEPSPETTAAMEAARQRAKSVVVAAPAPPPPAADATTPRAPVGAPQATSTEPHTSVAPPVPQRDPPARAWRRWIRRIPALAHSGPRMFTPVRIGIALMVATLVVTGVIELPTVLAWRPEPLPMKAVAVLPFRNIGSEADDGFLGEAIHQELLTQLGNVPRLRVIARGSVVDYRIDFDDDRTIAEALGVRYLIRGAIQVSGDRVRVWARLIDVTTAEQLWGSSYDAAREDLFPVQVQIAGQVAEALDVGSRVALWARSTPPSTANAEAYESYLRGRLHATRVVNQSDAREAVRLFENAVTLDPGFGPAYAALSRSRLLLGYVFDDPDQMAQSGAALRQAVALAPGDSDTWLAEAYHFAYWAQDYDSALDRLGRILTVRPSDADALSLKGFIERRQGSWEDAVATMTAALQVDPNAYTTTVVLAEMLMRMREYRRAERLLDRAIAISPGGEAAYVQKALLYLNGWGDTAGARDVLDAAPVAFSSKNRVLPALTAVFRGDAVGALEWLHRPQGGQDDTARSFGELHLLGLIYRLRGDDSRAAAYGDSIGQILAEARRSTGRVRAVTGVLRLAESSSYAAVAAALSADDDEAVREAEGAAALLPLSTDAYAGTEILERLAEVYALTDRNAAAIQVLHLLLSVPSRVTPHVLRLHPAYERLQADPAFLALLDQYPDVLQD